MRIWSEWMLMAIPATNMAMPTKNCGLDNHASLYLRAHGEVEG